MIAVIFILCYNMLWRWFILRENKRFEELTFFAQMKKRPGLYLGKPSLLSLRDHLFGMEHAFSYTASENPLSYFRSFVCWYHETILGDKNGYACWWNHLLYTSGNDDRLAFEAFYSSFEVYLMNVHHISLPEV